LFNNSLSRCLSSSYQLSDNHSLRPAARPSPKTHPKSPWNTPTSIGDLLGCPVFLVFGFRACCTALQVGSVIFLRNWLAPVVSRAGAQISGATERAENRSARLLKLSCRALKRKRHRLVSSRCRRGGAAYVAFAFLDGRDQMRIALLPSSDGIRAALKGRARPGSSRLTERNSRPAPLWRFHAAPSSTWLDSP